MTRFFSPLVNTIVNIFCYHFFFLKGEHAFRSSLYRCAILTTLTILSACNSNPQINLPVTGEHTVNILLTPPPPLPAAEIERLSVASAYWYDSMLKSRGFNGGIVVAKKGNIVFESYNGSGRWGSMDSITDSTSLHIASVSKTFTAMAVLKLWQDGKLNIDDEFSQYFPSFNYPGVTVRSMLNHRSGLPNYVHFMDNMGWNKKVYVSNEDVLNFLITNKSKIANIGAPNRGFTYCNTNYALLALLIEKLSGKKYGEYLQKTFFSPLQMKHSFVFTHSDSGKVLLSYDYRGKPIALNFLDLVYGDKNVYSTPRDLLLWDRALTSQVLFNEKTLAEAYAPYSNERPGTRNYGLGWRMNSYPSGKKMIYHNGWWHGNNAAFIRLLEDSATIIVLGNKYDRGIYHAKDLANLFGNYFSYGEEDDSGSTKIPMRATKRLRREAKPVVIQKRKNISQKIPSRKTAAKQKPKLTTRKKK
ncbi:MAG: serine hydrolase domain-containing protein [Ferruginibacter sp.]